MITSKLCNGSAGAEVRELQEMLGIKPSGCFGNATERAVRAFQEANGLNADGMVGKYTLAALLAKQNAGALVSGPMDAVKAAGSGAVRKVKNGVKSAARKAKNRAIRNTIRSTGKAITNSAIEVAVANFRAMENPVADKIAGMLESGYGKAAAQVAIGAMLPMLPAGMQNKHTDMLSEHLVDSGVAHFTDNAMKAAMGPVTTAMVAATAALTAAMSQPLALMESNLKAIAAPKVKPEAEIPVDGPVEEAPVTSQEAEVQEAEVVTWHGDNPVSTVNPA